MYNLKNLFKRKQQKFFYTYEKYKFKVKLNNKNYFNLNNYVFTDAINFGNQFNYIKKLNKNFKQIIIIFYSKSSKFFDYFLDNMSYSRSIYNNSFNFLKINTSNKKNINFNVKNDDVLFKPILIKKKSKKKLVLFLMVDGLNNGLTKLMPNTNKFFGSRNKFSNAWTNSEWTLPTFGNLISGKYTSNHMCVKHDTFYSTYFNQLTPSKQTKINIKKNMFEYFQDMDFVTGCYSPYVRINPTYEFEKGVDIFKHCEKHNTSEIIDNIIAQIEMFDNTSNLIFSHFFDTHGPIKDYIRLNEYSSFPDKNYFFDKKKEKNSIKFLKDDYEEIKLKSAFANVDKYLFFLFEYLKRKKFDDYTIILFGDHGTVFKEFVSTGNVLNKNHNNVGLYILDKKFNFQNKNNKFIETIDLFPSLLYRYSKNKYSKNKKYFDGKNLIYSNYQKDRVISESVREPEFQIQIKTKNLTSYTFFDLKKFNIGKAKITKYYDNNEKVLKEKQISKKKLLKIKNILNNHLKKSKLKERLNG